MIHGIAIKERKSKKVIDFIECDVKDVLKVFNELKVLMGVRMNLHDLKYCASEEEISEEEYQRLKEVKR